MAVWVLPLSSTQLIPRRLTPRVKVAGIRSLVRDGTVVTALTFPVLYLQHSRPEAIPQYISGSTSYLRVCLAFHPYAQLIQWVFNPN